MAEPFDHELKFRRAFDHLMKLDDFVKPWVKSERHTTRHEVDPKDGAMVYYATAEQPSKDPLSLLIGDILHNLRSGLDALAFKLATSYTDPLPDDWAAASEFPIFGDRDKRGATGVGHGKFHEVKRNGTPAYRSGLMKIRGWIPQAQTIVEGLQPYKRGQAFESDYLWILHELDRINKHRLLHVAVASATTGGIGAFPGSINLAGIQLGEIEFIGGVIETDTPYARSTAVPIPLDPSKEVYMHIHPFLEIVFGPGTPCVENQSVYKTLRDIYLHIQGTVVPVLAKFL